MKKLPQLPPSNMWYKHFKYKLYNLDEDNSGFPFLWLKETSDTTESQKLHSFLSWGRCLYFWDQENHVSQKPRNVPTTLSLLFLKPNLIVSRSARNNADNWKKIESRFGTSMYEEPSKNDCAEYSPSYTLIHMIQSFSLSLSIIKSFSSYLSILVSFSLLLLYVLVIIEGKSWRPRKPAHRTDFGKFTNFFEATLGTENTQDLADYIFMLHDSINGEIVVDRGEKLHPGKTFLPTHY